MIATIKRNYAWILLAMVIGAGIALNNYGVTVPGWTIWVFGLGVFGIVTWRLVKSIIETYHKAKNRAEKRNIIIASAFVALLGAGIFCLVKFTGIIHY